MNKDFLKKEILLINKYLPKGKKRILKNWHSISYSPYNCRTDELACTFRKQNPSTIYVNSHFFKAPLIEKASTLVHEAYHLYEDFPHQLCPKKAGKTFWCDPKGKGPYGHELIFLLNAQRNNFSSKKLKEIILKIKGHLF